MKYLPWTPWAVSNPGAVLKTNAKRTIKIYEIINVTDNNIVLFLCRDEACLVSTIT